MEILTEESPYFHSLRFECPNLEMTNKLLKISYVLQFGGFFGSQFPITFMIEKLLDTLICLLRGFICQKIVRWYFFGQIFNNFLVFSDDRTSRHSVSFDTLNVSIIPC